MHESTKTFKMQFEDGFFHVDVDGDDYWLSNGSQQLQWEDGADVYFKKDTYGLTTGLTLMVRFGEGFYDEEMLLKFTKGEFTNIRATVSDRS